MKCPSCGYENREDAQYCNLCQTSFIKKPEPESPRPVRQPVSQKVNPPPEFMIRENELNWFRRHLHWTWVFAQFVADMIFIAGILFMLLMSSVSPDFFITYIIVVWYVLGSILSFAALFGVGGWVLKQKGRSLAWLLIFLVPFGWFIFLFIENRNKVLPMSLITTINPRMVSPSYYT
jgi:hypothetical protein